MIERLDRAIQLGLDYLETTSEYRSKAEERKLSIYVEKHKIIYEESDVLLLKCGFPSSIHFLPTSIPQDSASALDANPSSGPSNL